MLLSTNQAEGELKVAPVGKCHGRKGGERLNVEVWNAGTNSFHLSDGKRDRREVAQHRDEWRPEDARNL